MNPAKDLDPRAAGARRFAGKIAVVAGAGQGIGRATARRLTQEGADVVVADVVAASAERVRDELRDFGSGASQFAGDLSKRHNAVAPLKQAKETHARILASEDASFITGQVLPVGSGATFPF